jgi:hypothetical protein
VAAKEDVKELRKSTEEFALIINDLTALGERIKLLQEEIAANLNEQSNRTLFTLTVVTVLALPINIIAGFFGMNVGGVPLSGDPEGFWILVALVATFTVIAGRWAGKRITSQARTLQGLLSRTDPHPANVFLTTLVYGCFAASSRHRDSADCGSTTDINQTLILRSSL